jgi:hypothetical protein
MPEEATSMVTCPTRRTNANNALYTKVLLGPPRPSRKNTTPWVIALNTIVNYFLANVEPWEILVDVTMEYISIIVKLHSQLKIDM